jgi:ADP-ribose pyrophosphatase YjhB (NUDIX family)
MTLGVRAACFDREGRIFMVRHTYVPGWYLPGGGVERHETALGALEKELREEGNLVMTGPPELFHVYYNRGPASATTSSLSVEVEQTEPRKPDREIAESGFFDLASLPEDVTSATLRRIREVTGQEPPSDMW